jgi:transcriptional regulator with XRE-family HTH domain
LEDLSEAARVSLPYLSEIERGRKEVSSEILAAICRALGLRLSDLLDEVMQQLARTEPGRLPSSPPPRQPLAAAGAPHSRRVSDGPRTSNSP